MDFSPLVLFYDAPLLKKPFLIQKDKEGLQRRVNS